MKVKGVHYIISILNSKNWRDIIIGYNITKGISLGKIWKRALDKLLMWHDCAFYFKRFTIDEEKHASKRISLRFQHIASHATECLKGKLMGTHFGP